MRPLCICGQRPAAINYRKDGKTYYRKKCERCLRNGVESRRFRYGSNVDMKRKVFVKSVGLNQSITEQFNVFHIDGDLNNCRPNNLKTICANCQRITQKEGVRWKQGDLRPDF